MKKYTLTVALFFALLFSKAQTVINSPDGKIAFSLSIQDNQLLYAIDYNKEPVIEPSLLDLIINGKPLTKHISVGNVTKQNVDETYPYRGIHNKAINKYAGAKISINGLIPFQFEVKVFNDGVAFRYVVDNKDSAIVDKENTSFTIPAGSMMWSQPNFKHYEGRYSKRLVDTIKTGESIGPPPTVILPNSTGYMAITEGGLTDFAGMSLTVNSSRTLQAFLTGKTKKIGTIETAWRIIEIGKDLNTLVNCDIIANISPAYDKRLFPKGYETDWVKPGKSVWSWLADHRAVTLENMKKFTDYAAELGFEYNLVDEGWNSWKDSINHKDCWDMMKELVDYSTAKGVKIWVWKAYPNRKGIPGIKEEKQRKIFFQKCKDIGIVGMKVDFFDSEAQEIIQFYQAALKDAAEYHLMMDFHGANKPTGETRTWPNEMTREAIKGLESRPPWAFNNTVLPFTRYLAGHADYTPVHFGDRLGEVSWAHHIASMVVFTSPFLCLGADPQSIIDNPCKGMIQSIPSAWDETIVLPQSKIGELVLYARRKGTTWFLAAMSSSKETMNISIDATSFLQKGNYTFSLVKDDSVKQGNAILETSTITATSTINIILNANGGFVGRLEKSKHRN